MEFAKAHGMMLLCLPPHCTHRMQLLDVSFFAPLDALYNRDATLSLKNHSGRTIGLYQVAEIFGRAYGNAASVQNLTGGFEKTGICPLNPDIFLDHLYLPSKTTENDISPEDELSHQQDRSSDSPALNSASMVLIIFEAEIFHSTLADELMQCPPHPVHSRSRPALSASATHALLNELSPTPKSTSSGQIRNKKSKTYGSQILTSSPFIKEIKF